MPRPFQTPPVVATSWLDFPYNFINFLWICRLWIGEKPDCLSFRLGRSLICVLNLDLSYVLHVDLALQRRHAIHQIALHAFETLKDFREETCRGIRKCSWKKRIETEQVWRLRCWRAFAGPSPAFVGESSRSSVLMRLIFRICRSSLTADCGILNVFAQSRISWTVMSAELLSWVLLDKSSSNGSSFMFINSSTCWCSSRRVMFIGTETTDFVVGDGGTSWVLLVIMIVSLAFLFFKFISCCFEIGVIVISLFSISFKICPKEKKRKKENESLSLNCVNDSPRDCEVLQAELLTMSAMSRATLFECISGNGIVAGRENRVTIDFSLSLKGQIDILMEWSCELFSSPLSSVN